MGWKHDAKEAIRQQGMRSAESARLKAEIADLESGLKKRFPPFAVIFFVRDHWPMIVSVTIAALLWFWLIPFIFWGMFNNYLAHGGKPGFLNHMAGGFLVTLVCAISVSLAAIFSLGVWAGLYYGTKALREH